MTTEERLEKLAKSRHGKFLVEYLDQIMQKTADVRTPLSVPKEIENAVRLGVIQQLAEFQQRLRVHAGQLEPPTKESWR